MLAAAVAATLAAFPPIYVICKPVPCYDVPGGGPPAQCAVPPWTCPQVSAANVISEWLGNMSGVRVPIQINGSRPSSPVIAVGYDAAVSIGLPPADLAGLGNESFVLSSSRAGISSGSFVVAGAKENQRADLFGAYELLRRMGCKFLAWDQTMEEQLPSPRPSGLPSIDLMYRPPLDYRDSNEWAASEANHNWSAALQYNGPNTPIGTDGMGASGVAYAPPGFAHTSYALLNKGIMTDHPPAELWASNREWFWPRADGDNATFGQLCWGNASMVSYIIAELKESLFFWTLYRPGEYTILSVSIEDNDNYCDDDNERAITKAEGSKGGALIRAVNRISRELRADFPGLAVSTMAYDYAEAPPKVTMPDPEVIIRLCPITMNMAIPITHPGNADALSTFNAWAAITKNLYMWFYVTNYASYPQPTPMWYAIGEDIKFWASHGVKAIFAEGSYGTSGGDMDALKDYLIGRLLWDPSLEPQAIIDEFLLGYFGKPAAPHVRTYLDIFNATAVEAGCRVGVHQYWTAPHLTPEAVIQGGQAFARAVDASTDVRYADRLKIAMMSVYYVAIYRWDELLTYAKAHSMKWPFGDSWQSAWAEFSSSWTRVGATMSMEGGFDLPDIYRRAKDPTLWPANIEWQPISCPPTCPCGD